MQVLCYRCKSAFDGKCSGSYGHHQMWKRSLFRVTDLFPLASLTNLMLWLRQRCSVSFLRNVEARLETKILVRMCSQFLYRKNVSKLVFKTSNLFDFYMLDEYWGCYNPFSTENVISLNLKQTFWDKGDLKFSSASVPETSFLFYYTVKMR